jgi:transposase
MEGPRALMTYEGTLNTAYMMTFTKTHLVPSLNQGGTVVMDGLSIHKNTEVRELPTRSGSMIMTILHWGAVAGRCRPRLARDRYPCGPSPKIWCT